MKLNESNLADPLLLTGCALGGPPWGSVGPFGGQDLISTTTFPEEALLLASGANTPSPLLCKNISLGANGNGNGNDGGQTGVELDALLIVQSSDNFAELKPLPPFEYTSAGPISLHNDPHLPQMSSTVNSPPQLQHSHLQHSSNNSSSNGSNSSHEKSPNSASSRSSHGSPNTASSPGSSLFDPVSSSTPVPVNISSLNIKSELADYLLNSDIDDIAALIGNAIADSTVPSLGIELDPNHVTSSTMDPWTELDAWIESACQQPAPLSQNGNVLNRLTVVDQDATIHTSGGGSGSNSNAPGNGNTNNNGEQSFMEDSTTSTLQSLLAADSFSLYHHNNNHHSHHLNHQNNSHPSQDIINKHSDFHPPPSILQSRLQQNPNGLRNGGNNGSSISPCQQVPESTTSYVLKVDPYTLDRLDSGSPPFLEHVGNGEVQRPHTTHVSPPAVVTSSMMSSQHGGNGSARYRKSSYNRGNKTSPHSHDNSNLINSSSGGYHHPSGENYMSPFSNSSSNTPYDQIHNHGVSPNGRIGGSGMKNKRKSSKVISSSGSSAGCVDSGGLGSLDGCGKEKPIHRCGICNRGFLNKSNIKVHLRTHTGEKPFKCDTCGKAFRQKAHLLKHVQIHKRIPRD